MTTPTHILQENGSSRFPLIDNLRSFEDQLRFTLTQMDGSSFWAFSLWRAPEGANLRASLPPSENYIQCAGEAVGVAVEVRSTDATGTAHQYTVGKPGTPSPGEPTETIRWDSGRRSTTVHAHEVLTLDEAAELFIAYYRDDRVPAEYTLRELSGA
ncbi:hypothetical protein Q9S78_04355 [Microbacterium sp. KSW-18]|uniref:Uncharacterized protein n=1 Tax=Microbacterium aquilitoris TaxID=3067307 RepID=A0ABU3GHN9_9MICO|nr:hypothetical protein [Microbacterium sp. KSW-18]MDT3329895.1 hypothetical protein [Microbacterium sp. KSW-18]